MKNTAKILANISIIAGVVLLFSPVVYVVYTTYFDRNEINIVNADAERETEILSKSPFSPDSPVSFPASYNQSKVDVVSYTQTIEENQTPVVQNNNSGNQVVQSNVRRYGDTIRISRIGLNTEIVEAETSEYGLAAGAWRVPSFSTPDVQGEMTVFIAHRWGEDSVSWEDRVTKLFYNIPNLVPGDIISINWKGTEYRYRVTYLEDSTYATRTADLLLVTCRYLSSDIRVLVYAERI